MELIYSVHRTFADDARIVLREVWMQAGRRSNPVGPAYLRRDPKTLNVIDEIWSLDGATHRIDGPAYRTFDPITGVTTVENYVVRGLMHRDGDQPAAIVRDGATGKVISQAYYQFGKLHRQAGPAEIETDPVSGVVTLEEWYHFDKLHRVGGPAAIERDAQSGNVIALRHFIDGRGVPESRSQPPQPE